MNRPDDHQRLASRPALYLILAMGLAFAACDQDIDITAPRIPTPAPGVFTSSEWVKALQISGTLSAVEGSCLEATILLDGLEIAGARAACPTPGGCDTLELNGIAYPGTRGHHTVAFQVLRQSPRLVEYLAAGSVRVELSHLSYDMPLGPTRATLGTGESVTFDATIQP